MIETFWGEFDLASLSLWLFWIFFAGLIFYIQRENMREGYPLFDEDGREAANLGLVGPPSDKTFKLPHGRGQVTVPSGQNPDRTDLPLERTNAAAGYPFTPVGDPMLAGVGPGAWAPRRDVPELDGHGHPKIVPMAGTEHFGVSAGRDPRGLPVVGFDDEVVGTVSDMWIDAPEQLVRYLEVDLDADHGGGKRLIPMVACRLKRDRVKVHLIYGKHFANVPLHASSNQVTLLEEEKISAYYAGGLLYASDARLEPQL